MSKLTRLNRLPEADKNEVYALLIPPSLLERFKVDPATGLNDKGERCLRIDAPVGGSEASVDLRCGPGARDQVFYIEVSDSRDLVQLMWDFIMVNDPESPRFDTDVTPNGGDRWLNWRKRNHKEEKRALEAGLAPGQVRRGLKLSGQVIERLEVFAQTMGFKSIALEALFYHNAILYERHGFRYFSAEQAMRKIHEGFKPGEPLYERLEGSTFRHPRLARTARGRSWLIHSNLLDEVWELGFDPWCPPKMYKMVGKSFEVDTAPGLPF